MVSDLLDSISASLPSDPRLELTSTSTNFLASVAQLDARACLDLITGSALPVGSHARINIYKAWVTVGKDKPAAAAIIWFNLAVEYDAFGDEQNKIVALRNALSLNEGCHYAAINLGLTLEANRQTAQALSTWQAALQSDAARTSLINHIGRVYEDAKNLKQAKKEYIRSLLTDPAQPNVLHHLIGLRQKTCEWPLYPIDIPGVGNREMVAATRAMTLLASVDDIDDQRRGNASYIADKMPSVPSILLLEPPPDAAGRIRIGYLSSDFCMHPIAYLIAELIEVHARASFEIYGFCSTKDDGSDVRKRLIDAFDFFIDIKHLHDEAAAELICSFKIDILIDLNGLTLGTRLGILRWRPAPIQITYLGYNGPIPLDNLDYIIADTYVIPPTQAHRYKPVPLYMPISFQVNDSKLAIKGDLCRKDLGLTEDVFIFCCFSNTYKITEEIFAAWMLILERCPSAIFWLYVDNDDAMQNLKVAASDHGIATERIVFARRVEPSVYRGQLALADLFLDTFPYNAGTTASDALRVGLPLISLSGVSFVSRMAGSLLHAMDLADCIVSSLDEYVDLAVRLASNAEAYRALRERVRPTKWMETLGDTKAFARNFEEKLTELHVDRQNRTQIVAPSRAHYQSLKAPLP